MSPAEPSADALTFARALRRQRRLRDLSQEALAAHAGISSKHLGEIERGMRDPRLTTIVKLIDALDLRHDELTAFWEEALGHGDPTLDRASRPHR
jgi:transcriptional regulator with XRE-family HTH domain